MPETNLERADPPEGESRGVTRAYWFLVIDIFLGFTAGGATMPFLSLFITSLGATLKEVALVVGIQSMVAVVSGMVCGRIADRIGRRRPFIMGAQAANALFMFAISRAPAWMWLIPLQAMLGVASGSQQAASLALMGDLLEGHPKRGRFISGYRMCGSLAFSIAIVLSGWFSQKVGLRSCFTLASAVYALAFLTSFGINEAPHARRIDRTTGFGALLRGPMRPLLIVAATFGLPFAAVYSVWPIWVADARGLGRGVFSQLWGVAAFVEVPCMFVAGHLVDRIGRRSTFVAGLVGFAGVYGVYLLSPPLPGLFAAQVLRGAAYAAFTATALTLAIDLAPPEARGRASGLFNSAQGLAQISGNWIGGPIAGALGFRTLFALAATTVLCGAVYSFTVLGRVPPASKAA